MRLCSRLRASCFIIQAFAVEGGFTLYVFGLPLTKSFSPSPSLSKPTPPDPPTPPVKRTRQQSRPCESGYVQQGAGREKGQRIAAE